MIKTHRGKGAKGDEVTGNCGKCDNCGICGKSGIPSSYRETEENRFKTALSLSCLVYHFTLKTTY